MANKTTFYRTPTTNTIPLTKLLHGGLAQYLQVLTDGGFASASPADQVDIFRDSHDTTVFAHLITATRWDTEIAAAGTATVPPVTILDTTIADLSTQIPYLKVETQSEAGDLVTQDGEFLPRNRLAISGTVPATPFDVDTAFIPNGADASGRLANTFVRHSNAGEWIVDAQEPAWVPVRPRNFSGRCTITNFATMGTGDVLTFGALTATETTDFTAETSNAVTAINLAAFIDTQVGFSAYATGDVCVVIQEDEALTGAVWTVVSVGNELAVDGSGNLIINEITPDSNSALGIINFASGNEADTYSGFVFGTRYPLYRIRREQQKINVVSSIDWYLVEATYWTLLLSL